MTRNYLNWRVLASSAILLMGYTLSIAQVVDRCVPSVSHSEDARIRLIKLDGKKYVTHGTHGYNNFDHIHIPLTAGQDYPIILQPTFYSKNDYCILENMD